MRQVKAGLRPVIFVSALRPVWSVKQVGQLEAAIGLIYRGGLAAAYHGHFLFGP